MPTLVKTQPDYLTIQRRKYGRGFQYLDEKGEKISTPSHLQRIRQLAIPPMWSAVRISHVARSHIQAKGKDGRARHQYIYHPIWQQQQQQKKFARLSTFVEQLGGFRDHCQRLLNQPEWNKSRVLALACLLLDETGIRIGNRKYSEQNQTYGLTTLRRKHLTVNEHGVQFDFTGKSGKNRHLDIDDAELARQVTNYASQPGYELFRYQQQGSWQTIDSEDVNTFIDQHMRGDFSGKDFRMLHACRLALANLPIAIKTCQSSVRKKPLNCVLTLVSKELGNTPKVCRDYYLHPSLIDFIENKTNHNPRLLNRLASADEAALEKYLLDVIR